MCVSLINATGFLSAHKRYYSFIYSLQEVETRALVISKVLRKAKAFKKDLSKKFSHYTT